MNRLTVLLLLLLIVPAHAQPVANSGFDPGLVANVYSVALAFMEPRTLDPVPIPTLTIWGLRGLTALDPNLTAEQRDGNLVLSAGDRVVVAQPVPDGEAPEAWAAAAVQLSEAAVVASAAVRRAGTQGIIQSFFDELFNHLDPYSRYVPPREAAEDRAGRIGTAGLGIILAQRGGAILVRAAVADGPAAMSGIRPGDIVLAVDGDPVRGKGAATIAGLIAGPEGTTLRLNWRGRDGRLHSAELERAMVPPETVYVDRVGDLLLLRITGFNHSTATHLAEALQEGMAADVPPAGIILDLRGNRGGLLREAVESADAMLPAGVVAYTAGRDPDANRVWRSDAGELAPGVPVVVVVDGRTASAAEILAAALTDRGRAVAVGSTTLGKGLVQTIDPLPDGGELFVTWSRVLAPRGWPLQGLGVLPQVCTSLGEAALLRQLAALAEGAQPMQHDLDVARAARPPMSPTQMLAIRRACPAAEGREADLTTARALIENPAAYAAALLPPLRQAARE
ncbi:MAG TPA: S41 family peptidase [Acetobacteraceae bacterium]